VKLRSRATPIAAGIALVVLALSAPAAQAEPTRAEYVAQLEPICQANTEANQTLVAGIQRKVLNLKLRPAGRQFSRAARAFSVAVDQVGAVPPAPPDAPAVAAWIASLRVDGSYLYRIATLWKKRRGYRAEGAIIQLSRHALRTNQLVAGWGFNYCIVSQSNFIH
jgi:hypothetical protein